MNASSGPPAPTAPGAPERAAGGAAARGRFAGGGGSLPVRLAATFAAFYLPLGIQMPYLPLWFQHRGLGPEEIGIAVAVPLIARLFVTPVIGYVSDRVGRPKAVLFVLALATAAGMAALALAVAPMVIFLVLAVTAMSWHPSFALLDSYASRHALAGRVDYGRSRQWGSGAFLIANLTAGFVITWTGAGAVVLLMLAGQLAYVALVSTLPELPRPQPPTHAPAVAPRARLGLMVAIAAVALVQASHALLYAFASVHWRALDFSLGTVGALWATGVAAEIALFRFGTGLMHRFGPRALVVAGGLAAVVRFGAMAFDPPLGLLFPLQLLHAFTFGATYLGMVELVARGVSAHRAGAGQSLAAWTVNIAMSAASVASGPLWVALGPHAFLVSAVLGLLGAAVALVAARLSPAA